MLENITFWTLDGRDYIEFEGDKIIIHRLDTEDATIDVNAQDSNNEGGHWLLDKA